MIRTLGLVIAIAAVVAAAYAASGIVAVPTAVAAAAIGIVATAATIHIYQRQRPDAA